MSDTSYYNTTKLVGKGDNPLFDEAEPLSDDDFKVKEKNFENKVKITNKPHTIIYNDKVKITNIDPKAYDYVVNGKSAIKWVMDEYKYDIDKKLAQVSLMTLIYIAMIHDI